MTLRKSCVPEKRCLIQTHGNLTRYVIFNVTWPGLVIFRAAFQINTSVFFSFSFFVCNAPNGWLNIKLCNPQNHGRHKDFFQTGAIADFSRGSQEDFSRVRRKWWNFISPSRNFIFHISLPKLQTHISLPKNFIFPSRKTTLFAKNVIRKCQISKYREPYPLPTPMHRMIPFCFETWEGCFKKHAKVSRIWFATSRSIQTSLLSLRLAKNICFDKNRSVRLLFATNLFLKLPKSQLIAS